MASHNCDVCPAKTNKTCGACRAVYFCSPACHKLWLTHKVQCGKPRETFRHAPLTAHEVDLLNKLHKMDDGGSSRPWCWHRILKEDGLWKGGVRELLNALQRVPCNIVEPKRSLIISDLRGNLSRAGCDFGVLPTFTVTPWVHAACLYRRVWRFGLQIPGGLPVLAHVWSATIQQYLVLNTLRDLRESGTGFPEGLPDGVEALVLQRVEATIDRIASQSTSISGPPDHRQGLHKLLHDVEAMRATKAGQRTFLSLGQKDGAFKLAAISNR